MIKQQFTGAVSFRDAGCRKIYVGPAGKAVLDPASLQWPFQAGDRQMLITTVISWMYREITASWQPVVRSPNQMAWTLFHQTSPAITLAREVPVIPRE